MNNFTKFFNSILNRKDITTDKDLSVVEVREIILKINEYFYTNYDEIGKTFILDEYYDYFSEFHIFWEKYHKEIINPTIDELCCEEIADILHNLYITYGRSLFYEIYDTKTLNTSEICRIRYFSANQDFRGTREFKLLYQKYQDDPSIFDTEMINRNPEDFLRNIGLTSLSQSDKRFKYALTISQILLDLKIEPYDLFEYFNKDLLKIKSFLLSKKGSGLGNKKIDMFLRDMILLNVWTEPINFSKIDVASDVNTIKVALRTGILKTAIPLLSSFLDIFCYQYTLIDKMNAAAWRRVWEIWIDKYPNESVESPCLIDYLVYRIIGKEFCKETLCIFECESQSHQFKWHSSRNRTCQICYKNKKSNKAYVVKKVLPCTDTDGFLVIEKSKYVSAKNPLLPNLKECPFVSVCNSRDSSFQKLNPPKSISILGQTGWETAKVKRREGGGGLMS